MNSVDRTQEQPSQKIEGSRKLKCSVIIVTYNEAERLSECLDSLAGVDQLVVIDLGSTDGCADMARGFGAEVYEHEWVPFVELVIPQAVEKIRNEWLLRLDPDEVVPEALWTDLKAALKEAQGKAAFWLPFQYYFLGKPLNSTVWGGLRFFPRLLNIHHVSFSPDIHRGIVIDEGAEQVWIEARQNNRVRHYWADSMKQLLSKHRRYLENEGEAKFKNGERFSCLDLIKEPCKALWLSLVKRRGILGGFKGIFLSFFYAWYICMSQISLYRYQNKKGDLRGSNTQE
ncbi:glycosyltransferase family 2 protein [Acidobacteriota bacterium]